MVTARPGRSSLGCLFILLVLSAAAYFGVNAAEVYVRYYRYEDGFKQEARFARQTQDETIRSRLRALADSLGLPDEAHRISIRRRPKRITIDAAYTEEIALPLRVKEVRFTPHAEAGL